MKKILYLMMAAGYATSAIAQEATPNYTTDALLGRWVIDINVLGGLANQNFTTANSQANYANGLNMNTGTLKFKNGYSYGADGQLGFFFGQKRHFGVGAGIMYLEQDGFANLDNYQVSYQAKDAAGNIFRQVVTGNNISENIKATNVNIPLVLKYKNRFSKHWGFTADAGALVNLQMRNAYTTNATFNYEAIYDFVHTPEGTFSVYDNSPVPNANDWLITKAEFLRNNPDGNWQNYVNLKRALGYSVGESLPPSSRTGSTTYNQASVGLLIQPSMNYFLSDNVALNFGVYYMIKPFNNNVQSNYHLTDGIGSYSSVLNNVSSSTNQEYGINIGARFFFGKKRIPLRISSIEGISPTYCGLTDGSIAIHGLFPNQPVTVDYNLNGKQTTQFSGTVQPDSELIITSLGAGSYTGIKVTIKNKNADGDKITLVDPRMVITSQSVVNPTATGNTDGSVMFNGLYAGSQVTISYNLNGSAQAAFAGNVSAEKSITMNGLGEGKYTDIVATGTNCSANAKDFTLMAPVIVKIEPPVSKKDISGPIQFDFDKSIIHSSDFPLLDEAYNQAMKDEKINLRVDGYTCIIGTNQYNQRLSERRANAVKKYLVNKGLSPDRIKIYGHGKNEPVASNKTEEGRKLNRRSVMKITMTKEYVGSGVSTEPSIR